MRCSRVSMPDLARAAAGALADIERRVVAKHVEKILDGVVGAEVRQSFDRPEARLLVGIVDPLGEQFVNALGPDATIGEHSELPGEVGTILGKLVGGLDHVVGIVVGLGDIPDGEIDLDGSARTRKSLE